MDLRIIRACIAVVEPRLIRGWGAEGAGGGGLRGSGRRSREKGEEKGVEGDWRGEEGEGGDAVDNEAE